MFSVISVNFPCRLTHLGSHSFHFILDEFQNEEKKQTAKTFRLSKPLMTFGNQWTAYIVLTASVPF